jgi:hypothetical protein
MKPEQEIRLVSPMEMTSSCFSVSLLWHESHDEGPNLSYEDGDLWDQLVV